jgi:hypothetical protein
MPSKQPLPEGTLIALDGISNDDDDNVNFFLMNGHLSSLRVF